MIRSKRRSIIADQKTVSRKRVANICLGFKFYGPLRTRAFIIIGYAKSVSGELV
jgi:hypothetical protein